MQLTFHGGQRDCLLWRLKLRMVHPKTMRTPPEVPFPLWFSEGHGTHLNSKLGALHVWNTSVEKKILFQLAKELRLTCQIAETSIDFSIPVQYDSWDMTADMLRSTHKPKGLDVFAIAMQLFPAQVGTDYELLGSTGNHSLSPHGWQHPAVLPRGMESISEQGKQCQDNQTE